MLLSPQMPSKMKTAKDCIVDIFLLFSLWHISPIKIVPLLPSGEKTWQMEHGGSEFVISLRWNGVGSQIKRPRRSTQYLSGGYSSKKKRVW